MVEELDEGGGASVSTDPAAGTSAATDVSLREYHDLDHKWLLLFLAERDRRYAEVQVERDKASVIQAETQAYKDMKANELREQLASERLEYASKGDLTSALKAIEATLKPLVEFVAIQQGGRQGALDQRMFASWAFGLLATLAALYFAFV